MSNEIQRYIYEVYDGCHGVQEDLHEVDDDYYRGMRDILFTVGLKALN